MKYDFTSIIDRNGKDAIAMDVETGVRIGFLCGDGVKIREGFDVIPMWVADMNFPTVPTIPEAIIERAKHPAYGYFNPTEEYFQSIITWHEKRNGVTGLTKECIGYENGVLGGVISALNVICSIQPVQRRGIEGLKFKYNGLASFCPLHILQRYIV